ncbi:mitoguardin-like [Anneissia japonica]|uniref:mitoguardin-like n=1 Tax=Anneissia japonica TaxID=1529436 RepID=UPI001425B830|nr:mitoguardin-like [Anneissia japonica]XP_033119090.1 mitoguardin-like [Anneissia japonica]XP_033119091.1 mitoguardin-like [Anneissia japonica]
MVVIGFKTKIALLSALSAITGLIIAASYFRRRKPRIKKGNGRIPHPKDLRSNSQLTRRNHGKQIRSPIIGSPKSPARSLYGRKTRSYQSSHSRTSSLASSSISSTIPAVNVAGQSTEGALEGNDQVDTSQMNGLHNGEVTPTNEVSTIQRLFQMGMDSFDLAVEYWENALDSAPNPPRSDIDATLVQRLDELLVKAYSIQDQCEEAALNITQSPLVNSDDLARQLGELHLGRRSSDGGSSSDSFVSATELEDLETLENGRIRGHHQFYEHALKIVRSGGVQVRRNRTKMLKCKSEEDFLAKVHCLREAMALLLSDVTVLNWIVSSGKKLVANLLIQGNYDTEQFSETFDEMMEYVQQADNWKEIREELEGRNVKCMSFYDIVLDFFILDSFDDLSDPPSSVTCITRNRWLSNTVKETALSTAIWSVLSAKRKMLRNQNGFLSRFYTLSNHISPALAWGFLGSDENLTEVMEFFKDQISKFCCDIFSLEKCRFSSVHELSDDILSWFKAYNIVVSERLDTT